MGQNNNFIIIYPPASLSSKFLPLGELYLADALIKDGYSVSILDSSVKDIKKQLFLLVNSRTVALGISFLSGTQLHNFLVIAKFIRKQFPNMPIIRGGAHISAVSQQTLKSEMVDYIICGGGTRCLHY